MIKELWNVGLKVTDLDREVAFLREVGASVVLRERTSMVGEEREYAILMLGGVRMLLFETVVFENLVSGGVRPGLTHAVYEVDDLDGEYTRISALGAEVLVGHCHIKRFYCPLLTSEAEPDSIISNG
jgi:hypothetical protein